MVAIVRNTVLYLIVVSFYSFSLNASHNFQISADVFFISSYFVYYNVSGCSVLSSQGHRSSRYLKWNQSGLLLTRNINIYLYIFLQVVIIDEAHNLSDTLSCIHSAELTGAQVHTSIHHVQIHGVLNDACSL